MDARYPVGNLEIPKDITQTTRQQAIESIARAPRNLRAAVRGLNDAQLDTPYREGGWTVRQVVHHMPDSHMNAYIRLKLAMTEDNPTIRPYDQARWGKLGDVTGPIEPSQTLLDSLHQRWDVLWRTLKPEDFSRKLVHPEQGERSIDWLLFVYEWHGRHHTAHITELRKQEGW
ncbi:MAG: putative metal-dependent hydrolase [Acidobacteriota bacterium]|nr:putative metal-dependent hydrolase [Acidobacteriota bacterium]